MHCSCVKPLQSSGEVTFCYVLGQRQGVMNLKRSTSAHLPHHHTHTSVLQRVFNIPGLILFMLNMLVLTGDVYFGSLGPTFSHLVWEDASWILWIKPVFSSSCAAVFLWCSLQCFLLFLSTARIMKHQKNKLFLVSKFFKLVSFPPFWVISESMQDYTPVLTETAGTGGKTIRLRHQQRLSVSSDRRPKPDSTSWVMKQLSNV